jgi:hypothetical protein
MPDTLGRIRELQNLTVQETIARTLFIPGSKVNAIGKRIINYGRLAVVIFHRSL